mgnify:FL=1
MHPYETLLKQLGEAVRSLNLERIEIALSLRMEDTTAKSVKD